jgi:nicotinamide mononucleotide transporter
MQEITSYILLNKLELTAAFFGLLYVLLAARENIFCWFAGIANVMIYAYIFYNQKIFANMFLQIVYLVISFYGLYCWLTKHDGHRAKISKMDSSYRYFMIVLFLLLVGAVYLGLQNSGSTLLMLDAITAAAGLIATWMQARKFIENWLVWIPTDITLTIMFVVEKMYVTAGLFLLYTVIAIFAYFKWKKELNRAVVVK